MTRLLLSLGRQVGILFGSPADLRDEADAGDDIWARVDDIKRDCTQPVIERRVCQKHSLASHAIDVASTFVHIVDLITKFETSSYFQAIFDRKFLLMDRGSGRPSVEAAVATRCHGSPSLESAAGR